MRVCAILGDAYKVDGAHSVDENTVVINWGNGILYDEAKAYKEMKELVSMGLLQPEHLMGWYYNMPHETPEELAIIRERYMPVAVEEVI